MFIVLFLIFEVELSSRGGNVKYFHFPLKNSFCNIQPFLKILCSFRNLLKLQKLGVHYFVTLTKSKYLEFSLVFVLLGLKYYFYIKKLVVLFYTSAS